MSPWPWASGPDSAIPSSVHAILLNPTASCSLTASPALWFLRTSSSVPQHGEDPAVLTPHRSAQAEAPRLPSWPEMCRPWHAPSGPGQAAAAQAGCLGSGLSSGVRRRQVCTFLQKVLEAPGSGFCVAPASQLKQASPRVPFSLCHRLESHQEKVCFKNRLYFFRAF